MIDIHDEDHFHHWYHRNWWESLHANLDSVLLPISNWVATIWRKWMQFFLTSEKISKISSCNWTENEKNRIQHNKIRSDYRGELTFSRFSAIFGWWKWVKVDKMYENGRRLMKVDKSGWKWIKWVKSDESEGKWIKVDKSWLKWKKVEKWM